MSAVQRVVLIVAPTTETRRELEAQLQALNIVRLLPPCNRYEAAAAEVAKAAPDIILLELDANPDAALDLVPSLLQARTGATILPASRSRDVELVLRTVRAGAREFLTLPVATNELQGAIERAPVTPAQPPTTSTAPNSTIIPILGAAGGVGCTTLAVNLAATLAKCPGQEVALVDFDLILGAVDASLDLMPDQSLSDVAQSVDRLDQTLLKRSLTRHSSGVYVLPVPANLEDASKIQPDALRGVLELLREAFPIIIVDLSKCLSESDMLVLQMATAVLVVVQLEPTCLRNSARLMELLRQFDGIADRVSVVANRVGSNSFEVSAKKAEELLRAPVKWQVPNEYKTFSAARMRGVTVESDAPGSRAHRAILELARDFGTVDSDRYKSRFGRIAASFF